MCLQHQARREGSSGWWPITWNFRFAAQPGARSDGDDDGCLPMSPPKLVRLVSLTTTRPTPLRTSHSNSPSPSPRGRTCAGVLIATSPPLPLPTPQPMTQGSRRHGWQGRSLVLLIALLALSSCICPARARREVRALCVWARGGRGNMNAPLLGWPMLE